MAKLSLILFLLGLYHGLNPGMGWLFATALGLQRNSVATVYKSVFFLSVGHAAAIAITLLAIHFLQLFLPYRLLSTITALALFSLGVYHLVRMKHPSWFGMQIGYAGITAWSFIIATVHGAGLMLVPYLLGANLDSSHVHHMDSFFHINTHMNANFLLGTIAVTIHTLGYLLMCGLLATLFWKLDIAFLKKGWLNFDLIWALALIITAVFLLFLGFSHSA